MSTTSHRSTVPTTSPSRDGVDAIERPGSHLGAGARSDMGAKPPQNVDIADMTDEQAVVPMELQEAEQPADEEAQRAPSQQEVKERDSAEDSQHGKSNRWAYFEPPRDLEREVHQILSVTLPLPTSDRWSDKNDPATIDFQCPGTYVHHNQQLPCLFRRPWSTIVPNPPVPEWAPTTPYELGRALTIAMQTHTPDAVKRDLLLDDSYVTLSPSALAVAYAYFRGACMHISQTVRFAQIETAEVHPPRNGDQAFDVNRIVREALRSSILLKPWTYERGSRLPCKRTLVILPSGFRNHISGFTTDWQHAYAYENPREISRQWFQRELSAIVLFSPTFEAPLDEWSTPLLDITQSIATGADLFLVAGPQDEYEWGAGVDFLHDVAQELIRQRPALRRRIINLLPTKSDEGNRAPHKILGVRRGRVTPSYTPAQAKRFLNETVICYGIHLRLHPYRRTAEVEALFKDTAREDQRMSRTDSEDQQSRTDSEDQQSRTDSASQYESRTDSQRRPRKRRRPQPQLSSSNAHAQNSNHRNVVGQDTRSTGAWRAPNRIRRGRNFPTRGPNSSMRRQNLSIRGSSFSMREPNSSMPGSNTPMQERNVPRQGRKVPTNHSRSRSYHGGRPG